MSELGKVGQGPNLAPMYSLFEVTAIRPPQGRERRARIARFVVLAQTGTHAINMVKDQYEGKVLGTYPTWEVKPLNTRIVPR